MVNCNKQVKYFNWRYNIVIITIRDNNTTNKRKRDNNENITRTISLKEINEIKNGIFIIFIFTFINFPLVFVLNVLKETQVNAIKMMIIIINIIRRWRKEKKMLQIKRVHVYNTYTRNKPKNKKKLNK